MSTVAPQWSGAAAAAVSDVTAEMSDMEAHIQQTNDRLLCIQQVSQSSYTVVVEDLSICFMHCSLYAYSIVSFLC